jgi:hypothetical protein
LKVTGEPVLGVVNQFNFSSLKKRIYMINKIKSARMHLLKFLFVVPLVALLLLSFRSKPSLENTYYATGMVLDAITLQPIAGAEVKEAFSGRTAITGKNGYYSIELPITSKELKHRCSISAAGYHDKMDDRVVRYSENIPKKSGSLVFVGLTRTGIGGFVKDGDLPEKNGSLVTHPDAAELQQLFETAKAEIIGERETADADRTQAATVPPSPPSPPSAALQTIFNQSQRPYHYVNGVHYLVNEQGGVTSVEGLADRLLIAVDDRFYTGEELNKAFGKRRIGACRVRFLDAAGVSKHNAEVLLEVTVKE